MKTAAACGIPAANVSYQVFEGEPAVVIERFDRRQVGRGRLLRLHQEDFYRILGILPENKYPQDGGPSAKDVLSVLKKTGDRALGNTTGFLSMLFFNYLLAAPDAHAKNYSLLIGPKGEAALAPLYDVASFAPSGKLAVKISTGETGSNYLRPELVGDFISGLSGTIVECNTAYGGDRSGTQRHLQLAQAHGFTAIADVDIMDADGSMSLPVTGGTHLTEDLVGSRFEDYDNWISLAHFKGHAMGGFGGAIKNCSIGIASSAGKMLIHSAGAQSTSFAWNTPQDDFLESMTEAAKAVSDALGDRIAYVNVMNRISVDCDCDTNPAEPDMADIGILASTDPVALDQACVDLVYAASDGASVIERIESRNGIHTLEHAEAIGLGSRAYQLVELD